MAATWLQIVVYQDLLDSVLSNVPTVGTFVFNHLRALSPRAWLLSCSVLESRLDW
jgi:hypothetical protein